jgi:predicted nucleic acid-binding protein
LPLSEVPKGTNIYIDANIFLFIAFEEKHFEESKIFLKRVHKKEVNGFVSIVVLDEVLFKLIQAEASVTFKIPLHSTVQFLKKNQDKIQELTKCWNAIEKILSLNITILDAPKDFRFVMNNCKEYKLMTRDSLHVSVMKSNGIQHIATNDGDFKRVPGITVWTPDR